MFFLVPHKTSVRRREKDVKVAESLRLLSVAYSIVKRGNPVDRWHNGVVYAVLYRVPAALTRCKLCSTRLMRPGQTLQRPFIVGIFRA